MAKEQTTIGEQVIYETRLSPVRVFFWPVFWTILFMPTGVLIPLGLAVLVAAVLRYRSTVVQVTSRRVVLKTGIIAVSSSDLRLDKIESVSVRRSIVDTITGSGTVVVTGSGGSPMLLARIKVPEQLRQQISECAEIQRG